MSKVFVIETVEGIKAFWVALRENVDLEMNEAAKEAQFTRAEKMFFSDQYDLDMLSDREKYYFFSLEDSFSGGNAVDNALLSPTGAVGLPEDLAPDYSTFTVVKLKEICRERDLPVSGKKADLVERIEASMAEERDQTSSSSEQPVTLEQYLEGLLVEYLQVKGGAASSRDVGRYLQANKSFEQSGGEGGRYTALTELKEAYGSTRKFVMQSDLFDVEEIDSGEAFEFQVCLRRS